MGIIADVGPGPIGLDTAVFIYFMEDHPLYAPIIGELFNAIDEGQLQATTSGISLLETLVRPLRIGNRLLVDRYTALLTSSTGLKMLPLTLTLLRDAAYLRAQTAVKTPDAIQLAAAARSGCTAFVTNDRRLPSLPGLPVVYLNKYLAGPE